MEAFQTAVEKEFNLISSVAKQEVNTVTDVNSNKEYLLNVFPVCYVGNVKNPVT